MDKLPQSFDTVEVVKELYAKVAALEAKVAALEAKAEKPPRPQKDTQP